MNSKMKNIADLICKSIYRSFDEDIFYGLLAIEISIEDIVLQIMMECCRYAYLKNTEKHALNYYIEKDGLEVELERKNVNRIVNYSAEKFDIEEKQLEQFGIKNHKPSLEKKRSNNRFPSYDISAFQYWEIRNIHDMKLVKAIVEKRMKSSKKINNTKFIQFSNQYDQFISNQIENFDDDYLLSVLKIFTLQTKYSFDFLYAIADYMERNKVKEPNDLQTRVKAMCGGIIGSTDLIELYPDMVCLDDTKIDYPMIMTRLKYIPILVTYPKGFEIELLLRTFVEANVIVKAVQSHISLYGVQMRQWFAENTGPADWESVFKLYDISRTFIKDKEWTTEKIRLVRKML